MSFETVTTFRPRPGKWRNKKKNKGQKRWSHQDELTVARGKKIVVCLPDGKMKDGQLVDADQFTVKAYLYDDEGKKADEPLILFKGQLLGIGIVPDDK